MLCLIARGKTDTSFLVRKIIDPDYLEKEVASFQLEEISDSPFKVGFRLEYSSLDNQEFHSCLTRSPWSIIFAQITIETFAFDANIKMSIRAWNPPMTIVTFPTVDEW